MTDDTDNGSAFAGRVMDRWAYENGVAIDCSRRSKPTDNAWIERFNGRLREECLNAHGCLSLADARCQIEAWRGSQTRCAPTPPWGG